MPKLAHFIFPLLILLPASAFAQPSQGFVYTDTYRECAALAAHQPEAALNQANTVLEKQEDIGMRHCKAMGLYALRRYPQATIELIRVEKLIPSSNIALKNYVIRQTARALNLSKRPDDALKLLQNHIVDLRSNDNSDVLRTRLAAEALLERALLRESYKQYTQAIQDLDHAVSLTPANEEILYNRAKIFLALNDKALARQDLNTVLKVNPNNKRAQNLLKKAR